MFPAKRFLGIALLGFLSLILAQCAEKESPEYVQEGIEHQGREDYDSALSSFLKAVEKDPKNPEAYYGLGGIYNFKKMYPEAAEAFQTALRLDPAHYNSHYSLGYTYELMGKKEDAEKEFQKYRALKKRMEALVKDFQNKR